MMIDTLETACGTYTIAASGIKPELYNWIVKSAKSKDLTKSQFVRRILAERKINDEKKKDGEVQ